MTIGRNDLCPCNSGKKYKKCCLLKEYDKETQEEKEWQDWFEQDTKRGQELIAEYEAKTKQR